MGNYPNIIVFDIETGGFFNEEHKYGLCEIAMLAIDIESLEEIGRYESLVAPYKTHSGELTQYTDEALRVNGIKISQIESAPLAKIVAKEIIDFANKFKAKGKFSSPILAGHNIDDFDIPFLSQFFELQKMDPSKSFNSFTLDTMWWSRMKFLDKLPNHKLATVVKAIGSEVVDSHRAMNDVEGNAEVVRSFIRSLRGDGQGSMQSINQREQFRTTFQF